MKSLRYLVPLIIGIGIGIGICYQFICKKEKGGDKTKFGGFTFATPSGPVPYADADGWVRNYREKADRSDLSIVFALNLEKKDIKKFYDTADFGGLRLYFGLKDKSKPKEISIIATGYRDATTGSDNEDIYLNEIVHGTPVVNVIDDMSKCPTMCPREIVGRKMLGLFIGPVVGDPMDRTH